MSYQWKGLRSHKSSKVGNQLNSSAPSTTPSHHLDEGLQQKTSSTSSTPQDAVRRAHQVSLFSSSRGPSPESKQRLTDRLGLDVIYQPTSTAPLDIIFVHGLGGANILNWTTKAMADEKTYRELKGGGVSEGKRECVTAFFGTF